MTILDELPVEFIGVQDPSEPELVGVVQAGNTFGLGFSLAQSGQEHAGEDGNDRNDDQQFDQCEALSMVAAEKEDATGALLRYRSRM
jgi:hypothetical protein